MAESAESLPASTGAPAYGWPAVIMTVAGPCGLGLLVLLAMARFAHAAPATQAWWSAWIAAVVMALPLAAAAVRAGARWRAWPVVVTLIVGSHAGAVFLQHRTATIALGIAVCLSGVLAMDACVRRMAAHPSLPHWRSWHVRALLPLTGLMSGALLLSAWVPVAAAPVAARIGVVLILVCLALQVVWWIRFGGHDADSATRDAARRDAANRRTLMRLAVFVFAYAAPFVIMGVSATLAPVAAGVCLFGLLIERRLSLDAPG